MSVRWEILALIVACGLVTFMHRVLPMLLVNRLQLSNVVVAWLTYIPVAIISGLFFKEMLIAEGSIRSLLSPHVFAGLVVLFVGYQTKNIFITMATGMAVLVALRAVFS